MNDMSEENVNKLVKEVYKNIIKTCLNHNVDELPDALRTTLCCVLAMMSDLQLNQDMVDLICENLKGCFTEYKKVVEEKNG
jgi:hypothetical protein